MQDQNSLAVYTSFAMQLYQDIAEGYISSRELRRELSVIRQRAKKEGFSFFTKTLPSFGKAVDMALASDTVLQAPMFKKRRGSKLPAFCGWALSRLFSDGGDVLQDGDAHTLADFRQFVYFMYKLEVPYSDELNNEVIKRFVRTEEELQQLQIDPQNCNIKRARNFISRLFRGFDARAITPKHGPGNVATGEKGGEKRCFSRLYTQLERYYPYTGYFQLGVSQIADELQEIQELETQETGTAKVVLVPKDSRGPRLISCEPLEFQWIQQGLRKKIYSWVESHPLTRGHVNFTDQEVNRALALEGSRTRRWATIDMKDASDRVSLGLVEELFSGTGLLEALKASRSSATQLPDGTVMALKKFAPMGSAVCFPVEALVFYALAISALMDAGWTGRQARKSVYVYGDDIIMRPECYRHVAACYEEFALKVNESKCCVSAWAPFRESCGCDAYNGIDVTPIRLRKTWCHRYTRDATELQSYVAISNRLRAAGFFKVADAIVDVVESRYGKLPRLPVPALYQTELMQDHSKLSLVLKILGSFGKLSRAKLERVARDKALSKAFFPHIAVYDDDQDHRAVNKRNKVRTRFVMDLKDPSQPVYQRLEVAAWTLRPVYKKYKELGWKDVLFALTCGSTGLPCGVFALPRRTKLKRGWIAPGLY